MLTKIRNFVQAYNNELFFVLVFVLVGLVGFGIGRLSVVGQGSSVNALRVESTPMPIENVVEAIQGRGEEAIGSETPTNIVGNKNTQVFHLSSCTGAKRMSETNKIYFASVKEALDAGFRPAGNCPGL